MAEFLIKAVDHVHPDPEIDASGAYKKGDIVVVVGDGELTGSGEGPPKFVKIKVPGLARETVENYRNDWQRVLDWEVVATDGALDGARIRVFTETPGAANEYGITRAQVENWLTKWGGSVVSEAANEVRFDITIQDIYKSEGFWGADPTSLGIVITETGYVQAPGIHTATIDVSGWVNPNRVAVAQQKAAEASATVIDVSGDVLTVEFERVAVRQTFQNAVREAMRKTVRRRRFRISAAQVDTILAAGGEITVTAGEAAAMIVDKSL